LLSATKSSMTPLNSRVKGFSNLFAILFSGRFRLFF